MAAHTWLTSSINCSPKNCQELLFRKQEIYHEKLRQSLPILLYNRLFSMIYPYDGSSSKRRCFTKKYLLVQKGRSRVLMIEMFWIIVSVYLETSGYRIPGKQSRTIQLFN